jgi:hypothetical protein
MIMSVYQIVAVAILSLFATVATRNLPAGTALPIMISSSISAKSDKPGRKIEGRLMQEVQLSSGGVIKKGARITGEIVSVRRPKQLTLRFDQLEDDGQKIPLNVSLRALASSLSVFQAGVPADANATEQSNTWTTQQVGGDYVFRGRGYVTGEGGRVGLWTANGVVGKLDAGLDCPGTAANGDLQALWVFSTTACKAYGFNDKLTIAQDGQNAPVGDIALESTDKELLVRGGSGWLLVVNPRPKPADLHK